MRSQRSTTAHARGAADTLHLLSWFIAGVVVALAMQWVQAQALGGEWDALLSTWDEGPLRPVIEEQLGEVTTTSDGGHDGQTSYVVALDPLGLEYPSLREDASLRWRRIFYPLVAGLGGSLRGHALLVSLTITAALGVGIATAAAADLVRRTRLRPWTLIGVLANPGVLLGAMLLTPDPLAFGLAMASVALLVRGRIGFAVVVVTLAVLTKEQYLLVALGMAGYALTQQRRPEALMLSTVPMAALGAWTVYVTLAIGGLTESNDTLGVPFVGMVTGISIFDNLPPQERVLLVLSHATLLLAAVAAYRTRYRLMRWIAVPWILAAPFLSRLVWQTGSNSLRVLLPLFLIAIVGIEEVLLRDEAERSAVEC